MSTIQKNFYRTASLFVLAVALGSGCHAPTTGDVSGKLTFRGKPLARGTISFISNNGGIVASGNLEKGRYTVVKAPVGPCKIAVQVHQAPLRIWMPDPNQPNQDPPPDPDFVPIPPRYQDFDESGLTYTVTAGQHTYDIDLKP
ncbi:MAG: hypothetical protein ABFC96_08580 [Thermoguttaceae bacterium]